MVESKEDIIDFFNRADTITRMKKYNINTVILFGSVVTDRFEEYSDIDISILSEDTISINTIFSLEEFLESELGRDIDVVDLQCRTLETNIKVSILDNGIIVYNDDNYNLYNKVYMETERKYKENETFRYFRERDVIWDEQTKII